MGSPLAIGVWISGVWAAGCLAAQLLGTRAYGPRAYFAPASGSAGRGVAYAFGPGMSPAAKESTRTHPGAYLLGVGYHLGIFASFGLLILLLAGVDLLQLPLQIFRILAIGGALCGIGLIIRRYSSPMLRSLSRADDLISNLLTTAFAAAAFARTLSPAAEPAFLLLAIALLLYIPLGKIRHCFFFFSSRYELARLFGRRGTFPPPHGNQEVR